jgi:hypothetical protein
MGQSFRLIPEEVFGSDSSDKAGDGLHRLGAEI